MNTSRQHHTTPDSILLGNGNLMCHHSPITLNASVKLVRVLIVCHLLGCVGDQLPQEAHFSKCILDHVITP
eukprot:m.306579 g.306579  ORF g.306579 m.306579 type:complete len:71 (+) comp15925_c0_seq1:432-644(+)